MREAYASKSRKTAKRRLIQLADSLEDEHPGAHASLLEGLDETLTIKDIGLSNLLERSLASTNIIENLNGSIRGVTRRVRNWKGGRMVLRWVASAVIDAEKKFRRLRGHRGMPKLVKFLSERDQQLDRGIDDEEIAA
jgi:putative transposase